MFEQNRITGHQRGNDGIDRRQVWVVPGRNGENDTQRLARNPACEPGLWFRHNVGEALLGTANHMARTLFKTTQFTLTKSNRAPHLPGELRHDVVRHAEHGVDGASADCRALGKREGAPRSLCRARRTQHLPDITFVRERALCIDRTVHRRNTLDSFVGHQALFRNSSVRRTRSFGSTLVEEPRSEKSFWIISANCENCRRL